jgi:hypothetical protein
MFLENSRYHALSTVDTTTRDGHAVTALKLRPLPAPPAVPHVVSDNDQLDVLAHQHYSDGTKFWHIADANTALHAAGLVAETAATILRPRS